MTNTEKYLIISPDQKVKILDTAEEINDLEFKSVEEAEKSQIFLVEFKGNVKYSTKVSLSIGEAKKEK